MDVFLVYYMGYHECSSDDCHGEEITVEKVCATLDSAKAYVRSNEPWHKGVWEDTKYGSTRTDDRYYIRKVEVRP